MSNEFGCDGSCPMCDPDYGRSKPAQEPTAFPPLTEVNELLARLRAIADGKKEPRLLPGEATLVHRCAAYLPGYEGYGPALSSGDIHARGSACYASNGQGASEVLYCPWCGVRVYSGHDGSDDDGGDGGGGQDAGPTGGALGV